MQSAENLEMLLNQARAFLKKDDTKQASIFYKKVLALNNTSFEAWHNLGVIAKKDNDLEEAVFCYKKALEYNENEHSVWYNYSKVLALQGKTEKAKRCLEKSLQLNKNFAEAHIDYAHILLKKGDYENGFKHYLYDLNLFSSINLKKEFQNKIQWQGEYFSTKSLLLFNGGGLGDAIQYARYLPMIKRRGGIVKLAVQKDLHELLGKMADVDVVTIQDKKVILQEDFDFYTTLTALPYIFGTTLKTIPTPGKYLSVDPVIEQKWQSKINVNGFKIGLVWFGNINSPKADKERSCSFENFRVLFNLKGAVFFSLQKNDLKKEVEILQNQMIPIFDLSKEMINFEETAAIIEQLDAVVTIDTAVAHLSAALGKKTCLMLPYNADWRWLEKIDYSPWYKSMYVFRQEKQGDWSIVIKKIMQFLKRAFERI